MTELRGQNDLELNLMESVEDVLAVLNIPDKQVLNETGLWQTISKLAAGAVVEAIDEVCPIMNSTFYDLSFIIVLNYLVCLKICLVL